jgi:hypothetical protein
VPPVKIGATSAYESRDLRSNVAGDFLHLCHWDWRSLASAGGGLLKASLGDPAPRLSGRLIGYRAEAAIEMGDALKAAGERHFSDRAIGVLEQLVGPLHSYSRQVFDKAQPGRAVEGRAKMLAAHASFHCDRSERQGLVEGPGPADGRAELLR